jgi:mRNA interferase MazF
VLVVSEDTFNRGPADLVIVLPITTRLRGIPLHVRVAPPEGGLRRESAVLCEAIRSVAKDRLTTHLGRVGPATLERIEDILRILIRL